MAKVVRKSNYDYEDWRGNQYFVAQRVTKEEAEAIAELMNNSQHRYHLSDDFYVAVEDNYVLPPDWEP